MRAKKPLRNWAELFIWRVVQLSLASIPKGRANGGIQRSLRMRCRILTGCFPPVTKRRLRLRREDSFPEAAIQGARNSILVYSAWLKEQGRFGVIFNCFGVVAFFGDVAAIGNLARRLLNQAQQAPLSVFHECIELIGT